MCSIKGLHKKSKIYFANIVSMYDLCNQHLFANPEALKTLLLRHVLPIKLTTSQIPLGTTKVKTLGGEEITIIR